jgi:hypothetical protein
MALPHLADGNPYAATSISDCEFRIAGFTKPGREGKRVETQRSEVRGQRSEVRGGVPVQLFDRTKAKRMRSERSAALLDKESPANVRTEATFRFPQADSAIVAASAYATDWVLAGLRPRSHSLSLAVATGSFQKHSIAQRKS